jgi:hypothetical protein
LLADQEKEGGPIKKRTTGPHLDAFIREHLRKIEDNGGEMNREPSNHDSKAMDDDEEIFQEEQQDDQMKNEDFEDEFVKSEAQQDDDSKSKKKLLEGYPEQNLLYRLLKQQGGPIRRTSCMKDYSTIYKKYKKRYNQKKKEKKLSEKVEFLRGSIKDDNHEKFDKNDRKGMELLQKKSNKEIVR